MSDSQDRHKAIKKITLKFEVESDSARLAALQKHLTGSRLSKSSLTKSKVASDPEKAIEELRNLGDAIRNVSKDPEGFK